MPADSFPLDYDEEPVMLAEVFITRRRRGDYLARLSIDEQAGWVAYVADDPFAALEGAAGAARDDLGARLRARRLEPSDRR